MPFLSFSFLINFFSAFLSQTIEHKSLSLDNNRRKAIYLVMIKNYLYIMSYTPSDISKTKSFLITLNYIFLIEKGVRKPPSIFKDDTVLPLVGMQRKPIFNCRDVVEIWQYVFCFLLILVDCL